MVEKTVANQDQMTPPVLSREAPWVPICQLQCLARYWWPSSIPHSAILAEALVDGKWAGFSEWKLHMYWSSFQFKSY